MSEIKKLPKVFTKNGYDYNLVTRNKKKAVYEQSYQGCVVAYEVIRIRVREQRSNVFTGNIDPPSEIYPGPERWGQDAWSIVDKVKALDRYKKL